MSEGWVTLIMGFMDMLVAISKIILAPLSALLGAWGGAFWTDRRERRREEEKRRRESSYLSILVLAHLNQIVETCYDISYDDGTIEGQPVDEDGWHRPTVQSPKITWTDLDVDWRVLPSDLMYDILNIPDKIRSIDGAVNLKSNLDGDPPKFFAVFLLRQREYVSFGLHVSDVARRLCQHADIPVSDDMIRHEDWLKERQEQLSSR